MQMRRPPPPSPAMWICYGDFSWHGQIKTGKNKSVRFKEDARFDFTTLPCSSMDFERFMNHATPNGKNSWFSIVYGNESTKLSVSLHGARSQVYISNVFTNYSPNAVVAFYRQHFNAGGRIRGPSGIASVNLGWRTNSPMNRY